MPELSIASDVPAFAGHSTKSLIERETEVARSAGYAAGWARGTQAARAAAKVEHQETLARLEDRFSRDRRAMHQATQALISATAKVESSLRPDFSAVEEAVLDTALELAQAILQHEVRASTAPGRDAMLRALNLSPGQRPLAVRMNPQDAATLANPVVRTEFGIPENIEIIPDPSLSSGDSVAQYQDGSVEARLAAGLARAREVLGR